MFIFRCEILTESCHRFLDLTGPLQIGGLPVLPDSTSFQVKSKDFVGCIADIYIDYKLLDLNRSVPNIVKKYLKCYSYYVVVYNCL